MKKSYIQPIVAAEQVRFTSLMAAASPAAPTITAGGSGTGDPGFTGGASPIGD